ncbi:MAG: hypothetical protein HUU38_10595, partial [Anaerolineales bacterium]|nr:hypothetical protein [Anaerolineales bacterium]
MQKSKILLYLLGGFLFLTGFFQTSPQINDNSLEINFPEGLIFHLDVSHTASIERITLIYGTDGRTCQTSTARQDMEFDPSPQVTTSWEWEFKRSGTLPPGVEITWHWEIEDTEGNILTTTPETVVIQDLRRDWKIIDRDQVVVQWYVGSNDFGEALHTIALDSLARLERQMGVRPLDGIYLTIYPTSEEVKEAVYFSPEWTGGLAFPEYDASIMGVGPDELVWAGQVIPHELTHLIVGALTFNCKAVSLPTWLDEGLAELVEGSVGPLERGEIEQALEEENLPRLTSLENGFSAYGNDARLSYWQSYFVVQFLIDEYGPEKMAELLATMQSGESINPALELVYGIDTNRLDQAWRASWGFDFTIIEPQATENAVTPTPVPTLSLLNPLFPTATETATLPEATATPTSAPPTATSVPAPATEEAPSPEPVSPPVEKQSGSLPVLLLSAAGIIALLVL